jgi:hypothetical protein
VPLDTGCHRKHFVAGPIVDVQLRAGVDVLDVVGTAVAAVFVFLVLPILGSELQRLAKKMNVKYKIGVTRTHRLYANLKQ